MSSWNKNLGRLGESLAEQFYLENGYHVLHRNYRFDRAEIDLIVQKNQVVVFVEVKTSSFDLMQAKEALTPSKLGFMQRALDGIIEQLPSDVELRFDLLAYRVNYREVIFEQVKGIQW